MKNAITLVIDGKETTVSISDALLRDWFAGQALAGSDWSEWSLGPGLSEDIANKCYAKANAMMKERRRKV